MVHEFTGTRRGEHVQEFFKGYQDTVSVRLIPSRSDFDASDLSVGAVDVESVGIKGTAVPLQLFVVFAGCRIKEYIDEVAVSGDPTDVIGVITSARIKKAPYTGAVLPLIDLSSLLGSALHLMGVS